MKFKKMRKWFLVIVALFTVTLVSCGSGDENEDSLTSTNNEESEVNEEEVTIRVAWWGGQDRHDRTIEVIELFEDKYPHINIEEEFTDWDGYWQRLTTQAGGGDLPDVIQMDIQYINEYDGNDLLVDLTPFITNEMIDLSDVDDVYQDVLKDGDQTLAISLGANSFGLIYNRSLAEEHGVFLEPGYTWNEFFDVLKELKPQVGGDFHGFGFGGAGYELFTVYVRSAGESIYNSEGTKLGFEEQTLVDFFTMVKAFTDEGLTPTPDFEVGIVDGSEWWNNRLTYAGLFASNQIVGNAENTDQELGLMVLPEVAGGRPGNWLRSSMSFAITTQSEQQEAAAQFIDFITNDIEANQILQAERGVPISSTVREALSEIVSDVVVQTFDFLEVIAKHSSPADSLPPAGETEIASAFGRVIEGVRLGALTPEEAATDFISQAEGILD